MLETQLAKQPSALQTPASCPSPGLWYQATVLATRLPRSVYPITLPTDLLQSNGESLLDSARLTLILCRHCTGHKAASCAMLNITGGSSDYENLMVELDDNEPIVACQNASTFQETVVASWPPVASTTDFTSSPCTSA